MSDIVTKSKTPVLILAALLVAAGLALVLSQVRTVFEHWTPQALILPGSGALIAVTALVVLSFVPGRLRSRVVVGVVLGAAIALTSLAATAAALLMLGASASLGSLLLPAEQPRSPAALAAATLLGLGILFGLFSLLLPFPVNRAWTYTLLLAIPVVLRGRKLLGWLLAFKDVEDVGGGGGLEHWARFLAITAIIASVAGSLYPIVMADDIVYHLRLANQLLHHSQYYFDVKYHVWASGPFASDLAYAIPYVTSGGDDKVHTAVRSFYTLAIAVLLWDLLQETASRSSSWFTLAMFFSAPIVHFLNHSMQQELTLAAFAIAGFWLIFRVSGPPMLSAVAVTCGALLAIKMSGAALAVALAALALWHSFERGHLKLVLAIEAAAAGIAIGIPAYLWCYKLTGNPLFPLFNGTFKSPLLPASNALDGRWTGHLNWTFLFDLYAKTPVFLETPQPGGSDASLLTMAPAAILIGIVQGSPIVRVSLVIVTLYEAQILANMQYLRYLFPGLPLLFIAIGHAMNFLAGSASMWRRLAVAAASTVTVGANFAVMNNLDWSTLNRNVWSVATDPEQRTQFMASAAPQRLLAKPINFLLGPNDKILMLGSDAAADFAVPAVLVTPWWSPDGGGALAKVDGGADAAHYLRKFGITHVFAGTFPSHPFEEPMMALVRNFGRPVVSAYGYTLYDVSHFRYGMEADLAQFFVTTNLASNCGETVVAGGSLTEQDNWTVQGAPQPVPQEGAVRVDSANVMRSRQFAVMPGYRYRFELTARCDRDSTLVTPIGFQSPTGWLGVDYRIWPCSQRYQTYRFPLQIPLNATAGSFEASNRPGESMVTVKKEEVIAIHD